MYINRSKRSTAHRPQTATGVLRWGAVAAAALLAGCGNIPKGQVGYYLAKTKVSVQVTRSVLCNDAGSPVVATAVDPKVVHQADPEQAQWLNLNWFRATLSDADVKVELFDDGRLKSVNTKTTGQGETIVKSAIALVTGKSAPAAAPEVASAGVKPPTACEKIKAQNKGEPILVVYSGELDLKGEGSQGEIKVEAASQFYASLVEPLIGTVCAVVKKVPSPSQGMAAVDGDFKGGLLKVRQPGWADFSVRAQPPGVASCTAAPLISSGRVQVAQFGIKEPYGIPIPKPAAFGTQSVGLVFAESGALTSVQYTSSGSATQALGGLNSLATAARGDTAEQKAADVKARADLIAQQQRLVKCIADPGNCPKE
jgi:hypothetical protein